MIHYAEFPAQPRLGPFIKCFWVLSIDRLEPGGSRQKILPDGCMEIVIHIGSPFRRIRNNVARTQAQAFLVGQLTECLVLEESAPSHVMGVRFKPGGAAAFIPSDLSEIRNDEVALESLWGPKGRDVHEAVINAGSDEDRIRILESFLLGLLRGAPVDGRVDEAVRLIERRHGRIAIGEFSAHVNWSPRQLERQFLRRIGIAPKELARTVRFQALLHRARGSPADWASLAVDCGFFDQAHMIREFRRFSGESPEAFLGQDYTLYELFAFYAATSDFSNTADFGLR